MRRLLFTGLLIVILLSPSVLSLKANIGNGRTVIRETFTGEPIDIERTIRVTNNNDIPVNITLKILTLELKEIVVLVDEKFVLQPNEEVNAKYLIHITEPYSYEGDIGVVFNDGEHNAGVVSQLILELYDGDGEYLLAKPKQETEEDIPEVIDYEEGEANPDDEVEVGFGGEPKSQEERKKENKRTNHIILFTITLLIVVGLLGLYYLINKRKF